MLTRHSRRATLTTATPPLGVFKPGTLGTAFALTLRIALVFACAGVAVLALFYNQPFYPQTWLDEGFVLQGALNLVRHGQYALRSTEGFRVLDQPLIANGPGIVLPIAASFAAFGQGLLQARMIVAVAAVATAATYFAVARRLFGPAAGFVALGLLLAVPDEGFVFYSRLAMGNVPALLCFLLGYLVWLRGLSNPLSRPSLQAVLAGAFFGLAAVTKGQYGLVIPILVVAAIIDRVYLRRIGLRPFILALGALLVCLGTWYAAQLVLVGGENFGRHLSALQSSSHVTILVLRTTRVLGNIGYLLRSGVPLFVLPGVIYAAWQLRRGGAAAPGALLLVVFVPVWLAWYVFASVGWARYALDPILVGLLCTANAVVGGARFAVHRARVGHAHAGWPVRLIAAALVVAIFGAATVGLVRQAQSIAAPPNRSPQQFAEYLASNVGPEPVVESWEWELDALVDRRFHHPTNDWVDRSTALLQLGDAVDMSYEPERYGATYLVDGWFSKWTGLYRGALEAGCCELMGSIGQYDLYRLRPPAP